MQTNATARSFEQEKAVSKHCRVSVFCRSRRVQRRRATAIAAAFFLSRRAFGWALILKQSGSMKDQSRLPTETEGLLTAPELVVPWGAGFLPVGLVGAGRYVGVLSKPCPIPSHPIPSHPILSRPIPSRWGSWCPTGHREEDTDEETTRVSLGSTGASARHGAKVSPSTHGQGAGLFLKPWNSG